MLARQLSLLQKLTFHYSSQAVNTMDQPIKIEGFSLSEIQKSILQFTLKSQEEPLIHFIKNNPTQLSQLSSETKQNMIEVILKQNKISKIQDELPSFGDLSLQKIIKHHISNHDIQKSHLTMKLAIAQGWVDESTITQWLKGCSMSEDTESFMEIWEQIKTSIEEVQNYYYGLQIMHKNKLQRAFESLADFMIKNEKVNTRTFLLIMKNIKLTKNQSRAEQFLNFIDNYEHQIDIQAYEKLVIFALHFQKYTFILDFYQKQEEINDQLGTAYYNQLLIASLKSQNLASFRALLSDMEKCSVFYNEKTFTYVISQNIKEDKPYQGLVERMSSQGIQPDAEFYSQIIMAFLKKNEVAQSLEYLMEMKAKQLNFAKNTVYNQLISKCVQNNLFKEIKSVQMYMKAENLTFDVYTYSVLMIFFEKTQNFEAFSNLVQEMEENQIEKNIVLYNNILSGYSTLTKTEEFMKTLTLLEESGLQLQFQTKSIVIDFFGKRQNIELINQYVEKYKKTGLDENNYNSILQAYINCRQEEKLGEFFDLMIKKCAPLSNPIKTQQTIQNNPFFDEIDEKSQFKQKCQTFFNKH